MALLTDDLSIPVKYKRNCTNKRCYFSFYDWFTDEFIGRIDLSELSNTSDDPFARLSDISGGGSDITVVANYSTLPAAADHNEEFYWVEASQGTKWLPGGLGGTYYNRGLYYSNGSTWTNVEVPWNATQTEVDTGTNNDKFVTPLTLKENLKKYDLEFQFNAATSTDYIIPTDLSIESITKSDGGATVTLEVDSGGGFSAYTLGTTIDQYDVLRVDCDTADVLVILEIEED